MKKILRTYKYRLYPTNQQRKSLKNSLEICRWLYNHLLAQRKDFWEQEKKNMNWFDQNRYITQLKKKEPKLKEVNNTLLQNTAKRVDLAFKNFFRRVKKKEKPGYPRFKGKDRHNSITYIQGFRIIKNCTKLSKIGLIKTEFERMPEGKIKFCTVKCSLTGKWFITFTCVVEKKLPHKRRKAIGLDLGIKHFATFSDGTQIKNPKFSKQEEKELTRVQRSYAKNKTKKKKKTAARIYERLSNKRKNFAHQLSRKLINKYGTIVIEDLDIKDMQKNNYKVLNKNINNVAWNMFVEMLVYKAEEAGRQVIKIDPKYTTQTCSSCGHKKKLKLSERTYNCPKCKVSLDRDHNAAKNILRLGLQSLSNFAIKPCNTRS